jgi:hypothetical protein
VVAGIAAWASWHHMVEVATKFGEDPLVSRWVPLSVDGMLVVASAVMADDKTAGRRPRASAKVAFTIGVIASVGANIAAAEPTLGARVVAAWPAIALLLVVEMLTRSGKPVNVAQRVIVEEAATDPEPALTPAAVTAAPTGPVGPAADVTQVEPPRRVTPPVLTSRAKVERALAARPDGTPAQIAADADVSESTARRYMPRNFTLPPPSPSDRLPAGTSLGSDVKPVELTGMT